MSDNIKSVDDLEGRDNHLEPTDADATTKDELFDCSRDAVDADEPRRDDAAGENDDDNPTKSHDHVITSIESPKKRPQWIFPAVLAPVIVALIIGAVVSGGGSSSSSSSASSAPSGMQMQTSTTFTPAYRY